MRRKLALLSETSQSLNVNSKFNRFSKLTKELVNKYLPLRPCTNKEIKRRENPWMTNAIFKSIKTKSKLYFIKQKHKTLANERKYKTYRNSVNRIIKQAKYQYYRDKLARSANRSKAIWSVINEILSTKKKKNSIKKIKKSNGTHTTDSYEIAEIFNAYFAGIGKKTCRQTSR